MIRLRYERLRRKMTQGQLGYRAALSGQMICHIEKRRWNPSKGQLERIGRALEIAPELLLQEVMVLSPDVMEVA